MYTNHDASARARIPHLHGEPLHRKRNTHTDTLRHPPYAHGSYLPQSRRASSFRGASTNSSVTAVSIVQRGVTLLSERALLRGRRRALGWRLSQVGAVKAHTVLNWRRRRLGHKTGRWRALGWPLPVLATGSTIATSYDTTISLL